MGKTLGVAAFAVLCLAVLAVWWQRRRRREDEPLVSLVLLLREPRELDAEVLGRSATKALGIELSSRDPDASDFVVGESPHFIVKAGRCVYGVLNVAEPYVAGHEEFAHEQITELRLREAFKRHRAWLAVDLVHKDETVGLDEVYRQIGKLLAELADDDCLAVYAPQTQQLRVLDAELLAQLRGADPLQAVAELAGPPVTEVAEDDPRMKAATADARRRWPEFVAAFNARRPGQPFGVKAPFSEGEHTEFIWVDVTAIEGDVIRGTLGNDPVHLKQVKLGDTVEVGLADLNDWAYVDGDEAHGGFTLKVLAEAQQRRP